MVIFPRGGDIGNIFSTMHGPQCAQQRKRGRSGFQKTCKGSVSVSWRNKRGLERKWNIRVEQWSVEELINRERAVIRTGESVKRIRAILLLMYGLSLKQRPGHFLRHRRCRTGYCLSCLLQRRRNPILLSREWLCLMPTMEERLNHDHVALRYYAL